MQTNSRENPKKRRRKRKKNAYEQAQGTSAHCPLPIAHCLNFYASLSRQPSHPYRSCDILPYRLGIRLLRRSGASLRSHNRRRSRVMEGSGPLIVINRQGPRISSLSLNGMEISVTEEGGFSEKYVLTPGYNRLILNARDKYGKTAERVVEIMYNPADDALLPTEDAGESVVEEVQS